MNQKRRSNLVMGFLLICVGGLLLAARLVPELRGWLNLWSWPVYVIAAGAGLFLLGLLLGEPDLAIPACIVAGIGGILYWQNATGQWDTWAFVWTLIPGFAGVGTVLSGLMSTETKRRRLVGEGLQTMLVSAVMFLIFASFFGRSLLGEYWPVLLILLGLILMGRVLFQRK